MVNPSGYGLLHSRFLNSDGLVGASSFAIDFIEKNTKIQYKVACTYFYFQEGEKYQVSLARIWATMLIQLLRQLKNPADELKMKWHYSRALDGPESLKLLINLTQASTFPTVYVVMDTLDSCQNAPDETTQRGVLDAIKAFPSRIRVLFSSGQQPSITCMPTKDDVKAYVKRRIKDDVILKSLLVNPQDQDEVIRNVTNMTLSRKCRFTRIAIQLEHAKLLFSLFKISLR